MRMNGMDYDIELTEPLTSQVKIIRAMDKVKAAGVTVKCAIVEKHADKDLDKIQLYWMDQTCLLYTSISVRKRRSCQAVDIAACIRTLLGL